MTWAPRRRPWSTSASGVIRRTAPIAASLAGSRSVCELSQF